MIDRLHVRKGRVSLSGVRTVVFSKASIFSLRKYITITLLVNLMGQWGGVLRSMKIGCIYLGSLLFFIFPPLPEKDSSTVGRLPNSCVEIRGLHY